MKSTVSVILLIALAFSAPFAIALYGMVVGENSSTSSAASDVADPGYDYPESLWDEH